MIFEFEVWEIEEERKRQNAEVLGLERQASSALKELKDFCGEISQRQKSNDKALQNLHRELGEIASAVSQQKLTAGLIEPNTKPDTKANSKSGKKLTKARTTGATGALTPMSNDELGKTIDRARVRGNRLNAARIDAWIAELKEALHAGVHDRINRALAALEVELGR